jgi:hypothetical protein
MGEATCRSILRLAISTCWEQFIAAKWAVDLGFSQFRQLLWGLAGLVAAPLVLLILYVRSISYAAEAARKWY